MKNILCLVAVSVLAVLAGFLFGLLGNVGSLHHAAHIAVGITGLAILMWAIGIFAWVLG